MSDGNAPLSENDIIVQNHPKVSKLAKASLILACSPLLAVFATVLTLPFQSVSTDGIAGRLIEWIMASIGILSTLSVPAAFITGLVATILISANRRVLRGYEYAITGMLISFILIVVCVPLALGVRERARQATCMASISQVGLGVLMYAGDHKGRFPDGKDWCNETEKCTKNWKVFHCPSARSNEKFCYALNSRLAGFPASKVKSPANTVLLFECIPGKNRVGGPELFPNEPRHRGGYWIVVANGQRRLVPPREIPSLNWDPAKNADAAKN